MYWMYIILSFQLAQIKLKNHTMFTGKNEKQSSILIYYVSCGFVIFIVIFCLTQS